jgi:hypothetical protein
MTSREYKFELLMAYWHNKKFFPDSSLTLDTTFRDIYEASRRGRRTCIVPDRQLSFEWLKAHWQSETNTAPPQFDRASETNLTQEQDAFPTFGSVNEEDETEDPDRDRILMEMGFWL